MFERNTSFFPDFQIPGPFREKSIPVREWKNGLLVRSPNWLGDAVMTFPALRQLRKILPPKCGLTVLCAEALVPLYQSLDCVDETIGLHDAHAFLNRRERRLVRRMDPGACLLFTNSFRDALSLRLTGFRRMRGAAARFRSPLLEQSFSFPPRRDRILNTPHQALKYLFMAYSFGAPRWDGVLPSIQPKDPPGDAVTELSDKTAGRPLLLIAPGAAYGSAKRWEPANFRRLAEWWIQKGGAAAALGSAKEKDGAREAVAGLPEDRAFDLAGRTSLTDLIHLFRRADLASANDSGLMHLAAVCGLKGIVPFGSTDPAATSPLSREWKILYIKQECAPCFRRICPDGSRRCMTAVTPDMMIAEAEKMCGDLFPTAEEQQGSCAGQDGRRS